MDERLAPCCERERHRVASVYQQFVASVIKIGELALSSTSDEEFYQQILELAVDVVPGAHAGSIQLAIDGTSLFRFIAAVGFDLEKLKTNTLGKEYLFRDIETPKAEIVLSIGVRSKPQEVLDWMEEVGRAQEIQSTLSVPVLVDGETVAFWALDNFESPHAFDESALEMMTVMAQFLGELLARRRLEAQLDEESETLRRLATCDPLTGLPNRREFAAKLNSSLGAAASRYRPSAVLFVDLDDLKQMNDVHGHDYGDRVLCAVGGRLQTVLRATDVVARWGGDEFLVLPARIDSPEGALLIGERITEAFGEPLELGDGDSHHVSLSIGVGWTFDSQVAGEDLIKCADDALYGAKSDGKGSVRLHKI